MSNCLGRIESAHRLGTATVIDELILKCINH